MNDFEYPRGRITNELPLDFTPSRDNEIDKEEDEPKWHLTVDW